jgi:hypothetical protein
MNSFIERETFATPEESKEHITTFGKELSKNSGLARFCFAVRVV